MTGRSALSLYVDEHLLGAAAGLAMFRHAARAHRGTVYGPVLERLADEVAEDRDELVRLARDLGLPTLRVAGPLGRALELAQRLRPGPRVLADASLATLLQLEALELGVRGKQLLWRALREVADERPGLSVGELDRLAARAGRQADELEALRRFAAAATLAP